MKKILITGSAGFIGRNIIESYLTKKYNFLAPSQKELDLTNAEKVKSFFQSNKIDLVIHTAAKPAHRNASDLKDIFLTDARMFFNIVRNSQYFQKMIFLSSGAVYGLDHPLIKVKEDYCDTYVPSDEYGLHKYVAEKYIGLADNIVSLRIFGIFGKYENYPIRFISNAICKAIFDLPITIKQNRKFDYLYVKDLMPVLEYFIEKKPKHKAYNITPDSSIEIRALAEKIKKISGKDLPIKIAQSGIGMEYSGDNSRLRKEIANLKFTPIDESIEELYGWYSKNKDLIKREILLYDK